MSKIFEALNRTKQEDTSFSSPIDFDQAVPPAPQSDAAPPAGTAEAPVEQPERSNGTQASRSLPIRLGQPAPVLPFDGVNPYAGEQYRVFRTKLIQHPKKPRLCLVSSAGPRDGKTITAINLAGALSLLTEGRVILLDVDLRRPSIAGLLGLPESPGLADVLAGTCALEEAVIGIQQLPNLSVLPAGKAIANPTEMLDSPRWHAVCDQLKRDFRFVILDVPPIVGVADYELVQTHVDGVIVVVRPDHTNRKLCLQALQSVPKDKLIGIAVNCAKDWFLWRTHTYSSYYYYAGRKEVTSSLRG